MLRFFGKKEEEIMSQIKKNKFLLAVDTVSDVTSIALGQEDLIWKGERKQSVELLPRIEKLLKKKAD